MTNFHFGCQYYPTTNTPSTHRFCVARTIFFPASYRVIVIHSYSSAESEKTLPESRRIRIRIRIRIRSVPT
jgi:hypothetical protein